MKSLIFGLVLSVVSSFAFAGGSFTFTPNFKLPEQNRNTDSAAAPQFDLGCGVVGSFNFCYQLSKGISVSQLQIAENKLQFHFSVMGSCTDFNTNFVTKVPRVQWQGLKTTVRMEEVRTRVEMEGQRYCIQHEGNVELKFPSLFEGQVIQRQSEQGAFLVLKLAEDSVQDWSPAIHLEVSKQFTDAPRTILHDLNWDTHFAKLMQTVGDVRGTLSNEFNQRAVPSHEAIEDVVALVCIALLQSEMIIPLSDGSNVVQLSDSEWTSVFLKSAESTMTMKW